MEVKSVKIKVLYTDMVEGKMKRERQEFDNIIDYTTWIIFNEHERPWLTIESVDMVITVKEEDKENDE